jgi:hypothetical protein
MYKGLRKGIVIASANEQRIKKGSCLFKEEENNNSW